jgi:Holliday junction DNA helicase RuvB
MNITVDQDAAAEIAGRSRGTPRIANRLLRRVRDFAQVAGNDAVTRDAVVSSMKRLEVDEKGFDEMDRRLLLTIIDKFDGGPVGLETLAAALGEEKDTLEDVYEPYLIQEGFLDRTPRGRLATKLCLEYFGKKRSISVQERLL